MGGDWPKYVLDGTAIVTFLEAGRLLRETTLKQRWKVQETTGRGIEEG